VGADEGTGAQHLGIGKQLLKMADEISRQEAMVNIAVISGIGVRDYYRKHGYELRGTYMMKEVPTTWYAKIIETIIIIMIALINWLF
jgi:elongator complex protein 3